MEHDPVVAKFDALLANDSSGITLLSQPVPIPGDEGNQLVFCLYELRRISSAASPIVLKDHYGKSVLCLVLAIGFAVSFRFSVLPHGNIASAINCFAILGLNVCFTLFKAT